MRHAQINIKEMQHKQTQYKHKFEHKPCQKYRNETCSSGIILSIMYTYIIYTYIYAIHIYIYTYSRIKRALRARSGLQNYITELCYRIIVRTCITELHYGIRLRNYVPGLYYVMTLLDDIMELY